MYTPCCVTYNMYTCTFVRAHTHVFIATLISLLSVGLSTEMDKKQPVVVPAAALQATGKANHLVEGTAYMYCAYSH